MTRLAHAPAPPPAGSRARTSYHSAPVRHPSTRPVAQLATGTSHVYENTRPRQVLLNHKFAKTRRRKSFRLTNLQNRPGGRGSRLILFSVDGRGQELRAGVLGGEPAPDRSLAANLAQQHCERIVELI